MVRGNPRLYGGLLVHVGVVSIAVAIAASSGYTTKREVELARGESATVRGFTVTYLGPDLERSDQKTTVKARVAVSRGGDRSRRVRALDLLLSGLRERDRHPIGADRARAVISTSR